MANVVAFGLMGMLVYPYVAHSIFSYSEQAGIFLGTAIHDTSQVMAAAMTYHQLFDDEIVLKVAAITKLSRNLLLAVVLPGLTWYCSTISSGSASAGRQAGRSASLFLLGFVAMSLLRSAGDYTMEQNGYAFGLFPDSSWKQIVHGIGSTASNSLLGVALSAVGCTTSFAVFQGVGLAPLLLGLTGATCVATSGFLLSWQILPLVQPELTKMPPR